MSERKTQLEGLDKTWNALSEDDDDSTLNQSYASSVAGSNFFFNFFQCGGSRVNGGTTEDNKDYTEETLATMSKTGTFASTIYAEGSEGLVATSGSGTLSETIGDENQDCMNIKTTPSSASSVSKLGPKLKVDDKLKGGGELNSIPPKVIKAHLEGGDGNSVYEYQDVLRRQYFKSNDAGVIPRDSMSLSTPSPYMRQVYAPPHQQNPYMMRYVAVPMSSSGTLVPPHSAPPTTELFHHAPLYQPDIHPYATISYPIDAQSRAEAMPMGTVLHHMGHPPVLEVKTNNGYHATMPSRAHIPRPPDGDAGSAVISTTSSVKDRSLPGDAGSVQISALSSLGASMDSASWGRGKRLFAKQKSPGVIHEIRLPPGDAGITLATSPNGPMVTEIHEHTLCPQLQIGDIVLSVDGFKVVKKTGEFVVRLLFERSENPVRVLTYTDEGFESSSKARSKRRFKFMR